MARNSIRQSAVLNPDVMLGGGIEAFIDRSKPPISIAFAVAEFLESSWVSSRTSSDSDSMKFATVLKVTNVSVGDSGTCVYWSDGARLRPAICNVSSVWRFL